MKICMVTPYSWSFPGGVNKHLRNLYMGMVERGHTVKVIAPRDGERNGSRPVPSTYRGDEHERESVTDNEDLMAVGRTVPIPANGAISRLAVGPRVRGRVIRALDSLPFDVVHVQEPLVPLVSMVALKHARCPVVGTFHAAREGGYFPYSLARLMMRDRFDRIDERIAVSESARELAARYFPGSYSIIPNGVDTETYRPGVPVPEAMASGDPVVLFVGRQERRKGLDVLLRSFGVLLSEIPEARMVVVGNVERKRFASLIEPSWAERISFVGFVPDRLLPGYYAAADLFCAPALGGESFGIVLLESMSAGTPVVASDIPGYREVLVSTGGGRLFKRGDPDDLAGRLIDLLRDDRLRDELAEKGRRGAMAYSWSRISDEVETIYESVVRKK